MKGLWRMPFYLLFAGIGEHVLCAGISAYGLKINMFYVVILFFFETMCRSCPAL